MANSIKKIFHFLINPFSRAIAKNPHKKIKLDLPTLKQMVHEVMTTDLKEITCGECYEELDQYAEFVLAGKDVSAAMPLVKQHLEHCPDCREEFEMLLNAIQSVSK